MKALLLGIASTFIALVLPGCLQHETTIRLNKDGSGTITERTTLGAQMLAMLEQFSALGGDAAAKDPVADMFSAEKAKAKAATMGEGVTFEKSIPIADGGNRGAATTYRFADINTLRISPGENLKDLSPMAAQAPAMPRPKPVTFTLAGDTLSIIQPEPEKPAAPAPDAPAGPVPDLAGNPEMEAMMKQMLGDMKMSFRLILPGGIAETDATYRDGETLTLMEMEMTKLLEKPDTLKKLAGADQSNPAAAMELMKGLDGVKMESKPKVTVKLR